MNEEKVIENEIIQDTSSDTEITEEMLPPELPVEEISTEQPVEENSDEPDVSEIPAEETATEETSSEEGSPEETNTEGAATEETAQEVKVDPIAEIMKKPPYHEQYYLKYGEGKRTAPLDLEGPRSFLQNLGFSGGELLKARNGKDQSEAFQNFDKNKKNQMYCSYCGSEISGVEYYRLPDGRLRCTTCSRSIVTDREEIQELCDRVIKNMDTFFGATIDVAIAIEVLDELKIKRKIGIPLGTRDEQSMLILGVAINKKKKYSLLLENAAPRISLIATFAHELTHIWQYTHWDNNKKFKKCSPGNRLLIYEGMAKWVEIQYLYLIGETNIAKREEAITRNRNDEYGIGFCLYEERYPLSRKAMVCEETPFTTDRYPLG